MDAYRPSVIERAFQLAESGRCRTVTEILVILRGEHYDQLGATFSGAGIRAQLKAMMRQARPATPRVFEEASHP